MIRELLRLVDPYVEELGSRKYIEYIYTILEHGSSADRQLHVYNETNGDFKAVVNLLIEETKSGVIRPGE